MNNEYDSVKLKVKKIIEREVKKIQPPIPPKYRYVIVHPIGEMPFHYRPFLKQLRKYSHIRNKDIWKLVVCLLLLNSILSIPLVYFIFILHVQMTLNEINIMHLEGNKVKISVRNINWFVNTITNVFTELSVKSIPSNTTIKLSYVDEIDFPINENDRLLVVNVEVKLLGILLFRGVRFYEL
ncbi:MAG: hypothetical protein QXJ72_06120 [Thermoproteota archaeon]